MVSVLPGTESQPHARAVLGAAVPPEGTPSHAYLLAGPAGSGKRAAARAFAAALLAEGSPDPENVRGRVERGTHPDLTWVEPSGAHELLVGDLDQAVIAAATRTPFEARRRVFVLEHVDTMIEPAANRLLKTLEEPSAHVHLLLLTDRPGQVLPTVASRCQRVRFDPVPAAEIAARLVAEGVEQSTADACARLALGDAERAAALATKNGAALRAASEAFAAATIGDDLAQRPWQPLIAAAQRLADAAKSELEAGFTDDLELAAKRDRRRIETMQAERAKRTHRRVKTQTLDGGLRLVGLWFRDLACICWEAPELVLHCDRRDALQAAAAGVDPARCTAALELVDDARQRLTLNVSEELACEALAYRLASRFARGAVT